MTPLPTALARLESCCLTLALALALALVPSASSTQPRQSLRGHVPELAKRLKPEARLAPNTTIDLILGLPVRNETQLDGLLKDLYDPASPRYRQFITPSRYTEQFGPTAGSYDALLAFARRQGFEVVATQSNRKAVHVRASAETIEKAFHVALNQYKDPASERLFYAPDTEPSIEGELPPLHVTGLDNLHTPRRAPNMYSAKNAPGEIRRPAVRVRAACTRALISGRPTRPV